MIFNRIINKFKTISDKRHASLVLKMIDAKGGESLCLAEHARVQVTTAGYYAASIGKSVTLWPGVKISLCSVAHLGG